MTIDAKDRVVAPGFIDMISYDPNSYGIWYKIADGVTTNLGMHGMLMSAEQFFGTYAQQGSPCHYGGAYDNYFMRGVGRFGIGSGEAPRLGSSTSSPPTSRSKLHQGWIGASFSPEYSPGITDDEIKRQSAVAAKYGLPCFFHGRYSTDVPPDDNAKTLQEIIDVARTTGAPVHVMHITSTGGTFQMPQALDTIQQARDQRTRRHRVPVPVQLLGDVHPVSPVRRRMAAALPHRLHRPRHPRHRRASDRGAIQRAARGARTSSSRPTPSPRRTSSRGCSRR